VCMWEMRHTVGERRWQCVWERERDCERWDKLCVRERKWMRERRERERETMCMGEII
jgi:hypothetical protein